MTLPTKRRYIVITLGVLLALFLIRPGATRLKMRIAFSIGMALQRRVEIDSVHLHLLPRPGFDLDGFVVQDDPRFSAEPVLRAQEVTALLRLSSLFRGHLEVSRLSLTEPSLNLVRREDGRWNIENFLERTAQIATAPTAKSPSEPHPAFPYIEADRGRINFKFGTEKKPFAITDASYSFWQDSPNRWGMRLKGQPLRTDMNLSDTGLVKISGNWQRAASLRDTPVEFHLQWDGAQLGQLSKLLSGGDRGWRATVRTSLDLNGTPANLMVQGDGSLEDFRRYDIAGNSPVALRTHCEAQYKVADRSLRQILCQTPVGEGSVAFTGEAENLLGPRRYAIEMSAHQLPLQALLSVIRRAKKDLPADLQASGSLDASFNITATGQPAQEVVFDGTGKTRDFRLRSEASKTDLMLDAVPFAVVAASPHDPAIKTRAHRDAAGAVHPDEPHLFFGPVSLKLGRPSPALLQGWIARSGYRISIKGESEIHRLLQIAGAAGIPAAHPVVTGAAKVDLQVGGSWTGFTSPVTTGSAEIHSIQAEIRGIHGPVEISSAKVDLRDSEVRVDAISASAAGTHWSGSLSFPRPCPAPCALIFNLQADEISTDRLNDWINPNPPERPWYRFSSSARPAGRSLLGEIRATGTLAASRVLFRNLPADRMSAKIDLDQGTLRLFDLRADVLNGKHHGEWLADFTAKAPRYSGTGTIESASLGRLAEFMNQNWVSGAANAKYQIEFSGLTAADFLDSAKGDLRFTMRDGTFPRIQMAAAPLQVRRFTGTLAVRHGEFELQEANLESPTTSYAVTGKVLGDRKLDFKLVPEGAAALTVTGTLADPRVTALRHAQTQASLKP